MSHPHLTYVFRNAFKLLICFLSFGKCVELPTVLPPTDVSINLTKLSESLELDNCPPIESVQNGNVVIKEFMGQTAAFITCDKNFTLIGKSIILTECVDGTWKYAFDKAFPKCEKRCPPPPYLEHGEVLLEKKLEDVYSPTGTYLEGTVATYTCKKGYVLEPYASSFRICENGMWTGADAFCRLSREINCARPPLIDNGYMQPSFPIEYSPILVGQTVTYRCLHGFKLHGSNKIKCIDHGIWSPEPPTCQKDTRNPFADFSAPAPAVSNGMPDFFAQTATQPAVNQNLWGNGMASTNAFQVPIQQPALSSQQPFNDLAGVFNTTEPSVFDPLGSVEPKQTPMVPPQPNMPPQRPPQPSKILTGDLESSLNSLVENLTMDSGSGKWSSPKNQPKTSAAAGWQPQQMATTTAASYRPMMGAQPQMVPQQPMMQQPFIGGTPQYMGSYQQSQMTGSPKLGAPATQPQDQAFDPFGAL